MYLKYLAWPDIPLSHIILTLRQPFLVLSILNMQRAWLGSNKYKSLAHWFDSTRVWTLQFHAYICQVFLRTPYLNMRGAWLGVPTLGTAGPALRIGDSALTTPVTWRADDISSALSQRSLRGFRPAPLSRAAAGVLGECRRARGFPARLLLAAMIGRVIGSVPAKCWTDCGALKECRVILATFTRHSLRDVSRPLETSGK